MRWPGKIVLWVLWSVAPLLASLPERLYTAENYDVGINADLAGQRLYGEARITLHSHASFQISALELDAGGLQISSVVEGNSPQWFERNRNLLFITLTNPLRSNEQRTLTIRYQAGPAPGLKFFPDQIYASNASDWMPCNDRPGERATLHLTIAAPSDRTVVASGQLIATHSADKQNVTEWQLDAPAEPSWFGFALGAFVEGASDAGSVKVRVLGTTAQLFEPTAAAIRYLSERSGKPYPGAAYTQVFVHGDVIHPMAAGLTLLPESYARELEKQPDNLWLLTSALAHQWYGLGIAPKDWSELWLSDGISGFLADAFLGQRFGKERFDREMQHSRQIYNELRAEGKDRALSDAGWTTRQEAAGDVPLHKGAWFLYQVNQLVGEAAFEEGLRLYTSGQWGHAATSEDLQKAFAAAGGSAAKKSAAPEAKSNRKAKGRDGETTLDNLFDLWVYGMLVTKSK